MPLPASAIPASPAENEPANSSYESADTLALLARRRSAKATLLTEPGPDAAQIDALIALAARVPDHGKLGPWRFVIIDGEARTRAGANIAAALAGEEPQRIEFARNMFNRAPLCVMVVSTAAPHAKIPEWEQLLSAGAAAFSLLISAHALGFSGCWLTEWPAYDPRARAALALAEHERIAGFVYLGATSTPATERVRADVQRRISRF